jgi:hypothetical protein
MSRSKLAKVELKDDLFCHFQSWASTVFAISFTKRSIFSSGTMVGRKGASLMNSMARFHAGFVEACRSD